MVAAILLGLAQATAEEWLQRLEARLREAHTIHVEARIGGGSAEHVVHLWFAAPDRMTVLQEWADLSRRELRIEGERAVRLENGQVRGLEPRYVPDVRGAPVFLAREAAYGLTVYRRDEPIVLAAEAREEEGQVVVRYQLLHEDGSVRREVELVLDAATSLPLRRTLTCVPQGCADVEEYAAFEVDVELPEGTVGIPDDFGLPPRVETHPWMPAIPRVTVNLERGSLTRACAELMEQTGWTFWIPAEASRALVTLQCEGAPAGEALAALERQVAGFAIAGSAPVPSLASVVWAPRTMPPPRSTVAAGPFLVRLERVRFLRRISTEVGDGGAILLDLATVPIAGARSLEIRFRNVRAVFDDGAAVASQLVAVPEAIVPDAAGVEGRVQVPVALPRRAVRRLDRVEGALVALLRGVELSVRLAPSGEPQRVERGNVSVEVSPVRVEERVVRVQARVRGLEGAGDEDSNPVWMRMLDDEGAPLPGSVGPVDDAGGPWAVEGGWSLPEGRAVGELELEVYNGRCRAEFPFELTDVGVDFE